MIRVSDSLKSSTSEYRAAVLSARARFAMLGPVEKTAMGADVKESVKVMLQLLIGPIEEALREEWPEAASVIPDVLKEIANGEGTAP